MIKLNSLFKCVTATVFFALFSLPLFLQAQQPWWEIGGNVISTYDALLGTRDETILHIITNDAPRMTILTKEEKIGIGTVNPQVNLHLHSSSDCEFAVVEKLDTNSDVSSMWGDPPSTKPSCNGLLMTTRDMDFNRACGFIISQVNKTISLRQFEEAPFHLFGASGKGMTIIPNGYVGFNTPYPTQKIHVVDENILISKSSTPKAPGSPNGSILFGANVTSSSPLGEWGIEYLEEVNYGHGLNFWKTWTPTGSPLINNVLFLQNDGKVGIGTGFPQRELDVVGNLGVTGYIHTDNDLYATGSLNGKQLVL